MAEKQQKISLHYMAIFTAAMISFVLQAIWYGYFMSPWTVGLGPCSGWQPYSHKLPQFHPVLQFATAIVAEMVIAAAISWVTQLSGPQTALRGIKTAALLWLAFVATTWSTQYGFELRPLYQLAINCGFWLLAMVVMGAITGVWKKK